MTTIKGSLRLQCAALVSLLLVVAISLSVLTRTNADARADEIVLDQAPRPIVVVNGTCAVPGQPAWPLNDLASPDGEVWGNTDTDRTQYSFTSNVPYTIGALMESPFAIVVSESADAPDNVVACANIGGITDQIGTLVVGFRSGDGVSVSGVAVLSPNASDQTRTMISAFLTGGSLGAFDGGVQVPDGTSEPTHPGVDPTVDSSVPTEPPVVTPTEAPIVQPTEDDDDDDDDDDDKDDDHGGDDDDDNSGHGGDDGEDDSSGE